MIDDLYERELDARTADGAVIRLLWRKQDGWVGVQVTETATGYTFIVEVLDGENPLDVFRHPHAYAAQRSLPTR